MGPCSHGPTTILQLLLTFLLFLGIYSLILQILLETRSRLIPIFIDSSTHLSAWLRTTRSGVRIFQRTSINQILTSDSRLPICPFRMKNRLQICGVVTINGSVIPHTRRIVKGGTQWGTLIAPSAWVKP